MDEFGTVVDQLAKIAAVAGGLIAAFKAIDEMRKKREEDARQLQWTQAKEAQRILEAGLSTKPVRDALTMLDWSRPFTLPDNSVVHISQQEARDALRTRGLGFTDKETYIRDCFDALFGFFDQVEQALKVKLVLFNNVEPALAYYVGLMARHRPVFEGFMTNYHYLQATDLVARFDIWRAEESVTSDREELNHGKQEARKAKSRQRKNVARRQPAAEDQAASA